MEDNEITMELTPYGVITDIMADRATTYYESENEEIKSKMVRDICQLADRAAKFEEVNNQREKTEKEIEAKIAMNKLDNEVKKQEIETRARTEDTQMALRTTSEVANTVKTILFGLGTLAVTNALAEFETNGYEPGKGAAFRFMHNVSNRIIKF